MDTLLTIIVFVLIFSLLVLIHELGHFWAAKRAGIQVDEFGFGLPPRIWGKKKGGTLYSLNWIPFGGFVKLKGEDANDPKMLHDPKSFSSKTKWQRFTVVVAGVVMNFLLAFILLTFGFTVGMEPLIVDGNDFKKALENGTMELSTGMVVKEVDKGSNADELGFKVGDHVIGFLPKGGKVPAKDYIDDVSNGTVGVYRVVRGQSDEVIDVNEPLQGVDFFNAYNFPAVKVLESNHQWFTQDTVIVKNPNEGAAPRLLSLEEFKKTIGDQPDAAAAYPFVILSPQSGFEAKVPLNNVSKIEYSEVLVKDVIKGSPADNAGIKPLDRIVSVNDQPIGKAEDFIKFTQDHKNEELQYVVHSIEKGFITLKITPDDSGRIGVYVTQLLNVYAGLDGKFIVYLDETPTSIVNVKEVEYPFYQAPVEALKEIGRLSWLTTKMFGVVIGDLLTGQGVPEVVSGPVGIYVATGVVVQEGLFATLRFIALLSLSLAVINILPFPALDGGRLLFILIEVVTGKRVPQKWETIIHSVGFILLILLILAVTYSDVVKLILE